MAPEPRRRSRASGETRMLDTKRRASEAGRGRGGGPSGRVVRAPLGGGAPEKQQQRGPAPSLRPPGGREETWRGEGQAGRAGRGGGVGPWIILPRAPGPVPAAPGIHDPCAGAHAPERCPATPESGNSSRAGLDSSSRHGLPTGEIGVLMNHRRVMTDCTGRKRLTSLKWQRPPASVTPQPTHTQRHSWAS